MTIFYGCAGGEKRDYSAMEMENRIEYNREKYAQDRFSKKTVFLIRFSSNLDSCNNIDDLVDKVCRKIGRARAKVERQYKNFTKEEVNNKLKEGFLDQFTPSIKQDKADTRNVDACERRNVGGKCYCTKESAFWSKHEGTQKYINGTDDNWYKLGYRQRRLYYLREQAAKLVECLYERVVKNWPQRSNSVRRSTAYLLLKTNYIFNKIIFLDLKKEDINNYKDLLNCEYLSIRDCTVGVKSSPFDNYDSDAEFCNDIIRDLWKVHKDQKDIEKLVGTHQM